MMRIEIPTINERAASLERRLVERLPILGRDDERLVLEIELSAHLGPDVDGSLAERLVRSRFESQAKPRRFDRRTESAAELAREQRAQRLAGAGQANLDGVDAGPEQVRGLVRVEIFDVA